VGSELGDFQSLRPPDYGGRRASIRNFFISLISSVPERAVSAFGFNSSSVGADAGSPSIARTPLALRLRVYSPESDAV